MTTRTLLAATVVVTATAAVIASCNQGSSDSAGGTMDVMFTANAEDGTISLIDAQTLRVVRTLNIIPDGAEADPTENPVQGTVGQSITEAAGGENLAQDLDISPDGRTLYVSRGHRGDVAAFDLASMEMLWKQPVTGLRADHMTISKDGSTLYVSDLTVDMIQILDAATGAITGSLATGQWPHDSHISADGQRLFNASIGNIISPIEVRDAQRLAGQTPYQITVFDLASGERIRSYDFDAGIRPFVLADNDTIAYAQRSLWSGVFEYDLESGTILRELELPVAEGTGEEDFDFEAPHHGLALTDDESTLCLAGRISDYAAIVDTATMSLQATIATGDAPSWATNSPDGRYCFIANNRSDDVSVISYDSLTEVARIAVGDGPKFFEAATVPAEAACPPGVC